MSMPGTGASNLRHTRRHSWEAVLPCVFVICLLAVLMLPASAHAANVTLKSPANGAVIRDSQPTLTWYDDETTIWNSTVQISTSPEVDDDEGKGMGPFRASGTIVLYTKGNGRSVDLKTRVDESGSAIVLKPGRYYWHVYDQYEMWGKGFYGSWSKVHSFTVAQAQLPDPPPLDLGKEEPSRSTPPTSVPRGRPPSQLAFVCSPLTVEAGQEVTVKGVLMSGLHPLTGGTISIQCWDAGHWADVAEVETGADGTFETTVRINETCDLRAHFNGTIAHAGSSSREVRILATAVEAPTGPSEPQAPTTSSSSSMLLGALAGCAGVGFLAVAGAIAATAYVISRKKAPPA
jgi:hypothetical protein